MAMLYALQSNILKSKHIQQLIEIVQPSTSNTARICKQIIILILYQVSSMVVTLKIHLYIYTNVWYLFSDSVFQAY